MNTLTENDRKLSETLRSLSLETLADPPKSRRKAILWIIGVLIAAVIPAAVILITPNAATTIRTELFTLFGSAESDRTEALHPEAAKSSELSPVAKPLLPAEREITGSGYVVAPRSTSVYAKYQGQIAAIAVDLGDRVQSGQTLVILKDPGATLALEQALAARTTADLALIAREIDMARATAAFARADTLVARNAMSRKDFEDADAAARSAANLVEQGRQDIVRADLAVRIAQEQVDALTVRAPIAGTVTTLNAHLGDTVLGRADSIRENQSLLALADMTSMAIDADIAETNISLLRSGLRGEAVLDSFPDQRFTVELQRVAPVVSAEKGTIGIRLSLLDPPAGIKPSMAARIRITVPEPPAKTQTHLGEILP